MTFVIKIITESIQYEIIISSRKITITTLNDIYNLSLSGLFKFFKSKTLKVSVSIQKHLIALLLLESSDKSLNPEQPIEIIKASAITYDIFIIKIKIIFYLYMSNIDLEILIYCLKEKIDKFQSELNKNLIDVKINNLVYD
jgi:hypothetical protein